MVCISGPSRFLHSATVLRWLYLAVVIGVVWYRLHKPTKRVHD
ncbi:MULTISPECIES: hypothetical protein [Streptomyces]|nr:hypothetical protein [Streptomyces sp. MBT27]